MPKTRPKTKEISAKTAADSRDERVSANESIIVVGTYRPDQMEKGSLSREDNAIIEDNRFGEIAKLASRDAVERTFAAGLPITFWKDGRLFHQFPDGKECPVPASEISEVIGDACQ